MRELQGEDETGWVTCESPVQPVIGRDSFNVAKGLAAYAKHKRETAIPSVQEFLACGVERIVEETTGNPWRGGGVTSLVNALIQIAEEACVTLPKNRNVEMCLDHIYDHVVGFVKAVGCKAERVELSQLIDAVDELGFTLVIYYGQVAETANLKIRVLSRLLLVGVTKPILDSGDKSVHIDFDRLSKIKRFRER